MAPAVKPAASAVPSIRHPLLPYRRRLPAAAPKLSLRLVRACSTDSFDSASHSLWAFSPVFS